MDEKQLDFNAPLLSVRRLSTTSSNLDALSANTTRKTKPMRQQSLPVPKSEWELEDNDELTKPAAVPFLWEQIPGKAKHPKKPASQPLQNGPHSQRFHPETIEDDSGEEEDLYADAVDALSNSFSFNGSGENTNLESSGSFSSDLQTRDYLMNRFLPAAKSMIVETPQYVTKKQEPVGALPEPPKYVKKVYSGELRPLLLEKYPTNSVLPYEHSEIDKESDEFEGSKKKSGRKSFGFFLPRICTKSSSCLSNPSSGSKAKIHQSQPPVTATAAPLPGRIPRLSRRTAYSGPLTPSIEKQAMDAVIRKRAEFRPKEVHETQLKLSPLNLSRDSSPQRGSSRSGRISPYRNESPRSPFHDGARFLGVPKDAPNQTVKPKTCPSLNVKSHFTPRLIPDKPSATVSPLVPEKTLYVDSVETRKDLTHYEIKPDSNDNKIEPNDADLEVLHAPPLPKSPSESWLWRTMTLRSPFPKKQGQGEGQVPKIPKTGPKWETIVKTSNMRHDHVRYSEELLKVAQHSEI